MRLACALLLLVASSAAAATFYVDGTSGSDAAGGTSRGASAWRTWPRLLDAIEAGTVGADDTVFIRPGRYGTTGFNANWLQTGGGSSDAHRLTISVDTFYSGDVEITGAQAAGQAGASGWHTAYACAGTTDPALVGLVCDSGGGTPIDARCPGGSCSPVSNVYWMSTGMPGASNFALPGMAFQPDPVPGGAPCTTNADCGNTRACDQYIGRCDPTLFEILYAPEQVPIIMPSFPSGRNSTWVYKEIPFTTGGGSACRAASVPWACCTGLGSGPTCLTTDRTYVRMKDNTNPELAVPPVMVPMEAPLVFYNKVGGTGAQYITFTNNDNGRLFHFLWGQAGVITFGNAIGITIEDFDAGFNSMSRAVDPGFATSNTWLYSGAAWPRGNGGPQYIIEMQPGYGTGTCASPPRARDLKLRRGFIRKSAGDELIHNDCMEIGPGGYGDTSNALLLEDVEMYESPWLVAVGASRDMDNDGVDDLNDIGADIYGHSNYVWPPTNYRAGWSVQVQGMFSPLGGGGESAGCFIFGSGGNHVNRINCHHAHALQLESVAAVGNLIENSVIRPNYVKFTGNKDNAPTATPTFPTARCLNGPTGTCPGGFAQRRSTTMPSCASGSDKPGNIWRNSFLLDIYRFESFGAVNEGCSARQTAPQIVNNTFTFRTDATNFSGDPSFGFGEQFDIQPFWGTAAAKAQIMNNIFLRYASSGALMAIVSDSAATTQIDYNLWSPNMRWEWAGATLTTFAAWQAAVAAGGTGNEVHSAQAASIGSIGLISATDAHLLSGSVARNPATSVCTLATDIDDESRPMGASCDRGADEYNESTPVTTSTSTSSTSSTSTSSTTSTTAPGATTSTSTSTSVSTSTSTSSTTSTTIAGLGIEMRGGEFRGGQIRR